MNPEEETKDDRDIAQLLRGVGPRSDPPEDITQSVRLAVEAQWHAVVARRAGKRKLVGWSLAAAAALIAIGAWVYFPSPRPKGDRVAEVSATIGSLTANSGSWGRWQPVHLHEAVRTGQKLATDPEGRAALALPGNVSLRLDRDTRIAVLDSRHFTIERGAVYVDAGSDLIPDAERLQIVTPAGAVRHVGTQYEVRLVDSGVRIAVREGKIELDASSGTAQLAVAGEQMMVSASGTVERRSLSRDDASWRWVITAAPAFDIEGRPLAQLLTWAARELGRDVVYATPQSEAEASQVLLSGSISGLSPTEALAAVLPTTPLKVEDRGGRLVVSLSRAP